MSTYRPIACAMAAALGLAAGLQAAGPAQDRESPYLTILSANIAEESFAEEKPMLERVATLTITVAGRPECGREGAALSYAFLADADRSRGTGAATRAFSELGVDAKLEIHCDPATGRLASPLGEVTVRPASESPQGHTIQLITRVARLPSLNFHWIAVAREGRRFDRLPAAGRSGAWRIAELWIG